MLTPEESVEYLIRFCIWALVSVALAAGVIGFGVGLSL